jgi:hypothetical protein
MLMLRNPSFVCVIALGLCVTAWPQELGARGNSPIQQNAPSQSTTSANQTRTPRIAPGSVIPVELTKGIDAKKAKTGDPVEAKVTMDLKTDTGEVLVPKDTKVLGHVTEAQARTKEQKESQVAIAFDHAVTKSGGNMPLPLSIQAVISPSAANGGGNNNAPYEGTRPSGSQPSSGGAAPTTGSRGGMNTGAPPPQTPGGLPPDSTTQAGGNARQPLTGKTEGVVGISNLKLSLAPQPAQGSVLTSDKNNVKLESGTLMLLKVNP